MEHQDLKDATQSNVSYTLDQENRILRERHDHVCGLLKGLLIEMERKERMWRSRDQRLKFRVLMLERELDNTKKMIAERGTEESSSQVVLRESEDEEDLNGSCETIFDFDEDFYATEQGCSAVIAEETPSTARRLSSTPSENRSTIGDDETEKQRKNIAVPIMSRYGDDSLKNTCSESSKVSLGGSNERHVSQNSPSGCPSCDVGNAKPCIQNEDSKQSSGKGGAFFRSFRVRCTDDNSTASLTACASCSSVSMSMAPSEGVGR